MADGDDEEEPIQGSSQVSSWRHKGWEVKHLRSPPKPSHVNARSRLPPLPAGRDSPFTRKLRLPSEGGCGGTRKAPTPQPWGRTTAPRLKLRRKAATAGQREIPFYRGNRGALAITLH